jgi:hypothetical protein
MWNRESIELNWFRQGILVPAKPNPKTATSLSAGLEQRPRIPPQLPYQICNSSSNVARSVFCACSLLIRPAGQLSRSELLRADPRLGE